MTSAVIGLGETGRPLFEILSKAYTDIVGIDKKEIVHHPKADRNFWGCLDPTPIDEYEKSYHCDVLNICIPYSNEFFHDVEEWQRLCKNPELTIIHSTVPIGTTSKIKNAVHSPILGLHNRMKEDLKIYRKWIGGELADEAMDYLGDAGFLCRSVATSEETEALKLLCLAKYGMSIAFAQYCKDIADEYGFDYNDVGEWDVNYNNGVAPWLKRPILAPPGKKIGGHCVTQNTKILNEQHPNPILEEILKYA